MQLFQYQAARNDGSIVRGVVEASSSGEANTSLLERGLYPLRLEVARSGEGRRSSAGRRELAIAFRSISALVTAGVPLERAVGASESLVHGVLRQCLTEARTALRAGRSFAQALEATRGVVPGESSPRW
jgi:type II secretory pathway component PulF